MARENACLGDDFEPLNFERGSDGVFIDGRVQKVYDAGVISELKQAAGRARD